VKWLAEKGPVMIVGVGQEMITQKEDTTLQLPLFCDGLDLDHRTWIYPILERDRHDEEHCFFYPLKNDDFQRGIHVGLGSFLCPLSHLS